MKFWREWNEAAAGKRVLWILHRLFVIADGIIPGGTFVWIGRIVLVLAGALAFTWIAFWVYFAIQASNDPTVEIFGLAPLKGNLLLMAAGVVVVASFVLFPFFIPRTKENGLTVPKRFELAVLLGGGIVALAGAVFLIGEYQDQKQARITRAWDLLHKATQRAYDRMNVAERGIDKAIADKQQEIEERGCKDPDPPEDCETLSEAKKKLVQGRDETVRRDREIAARGNDGQLGALRTLNAASVPLDNIRLEEIDLTQLDLPEASMVRANLIDAYLSGANLSDADLSGANLIDAYLSDANLSGANLFRANLSEANLSGANLIDAYLSGANLFRANLSEANLSGANLSAANLFRANLSEANLSGANLSAAKFCRTTMPDDSRCDRDCDPAEECPWLQQRGENN